MLIVSLMCHYLGSTYVLHKESRRELLVCKIGGCTAFSHRTAAFLFAKQQTLGRQSTLGIVGASRAGVSITASASVGIINGSSELAAARSHAGSWRLLLKMMNCPSDVPLGEPGDVSIATQSTIHPPAQGSAGESPSLKGWTNGHEVLRDMGQR